MDKYISSIKRFINKNINKQNTKDFLLAHKNTLIVIVAIILLGGIVTAASYAYFQTIANQAIVGGQVGTITNINMYYFVEDKNASTGAGLGTYSKSVYLPRTTYTYNSSLSYCKHGSTLSYNASTYTFTVSNTKDACYAYFDVSLAANADIILDIYVQKNGEYKKVNEIPNGYAFALNTTLSSCTNGATMSLTRGRIVVSATSKTVCNAYLESVPASYWNDNFDGTYVYSYPLGQRADWDLYQYDDEIWENGSPTTYTTLAQLKSNTTNFANSPVYIKTTTTEHEACLYYNNREFCLGTNTYDTEDLMMQFQASMEAALQTSADECGLEYSYSWCKFGDFSCGTTQYGEVSCSSDVSGDGCVLNSDGTAVCS